MPRSRLPALALRACTPSRCLATLSSVIHCLCNATPPRHLASSRPSSGIKAGTAQPWSWVHMPQELWSHNASSSARLPTRAGAALPGSVLRLRGHLACPCGHCRGGHQGRLGRGLLSCHDRLLQGQPPRCRGRPCPRCMALKPVVRLVTLMWRRAASQCIMLEPAVSQASLGRLVKVLGCIASLLTAAAQ